MLGVTVKNAWFKHYNTASTGSTIRRLWDAKKFEAIALYWLVLELISRFEKDDKRGFISINLGVLRRETNWKLDKIQRELSRLYSDSLSIVIGSSNGIAEQSELNLDTIVEISSGNWLELQETRGSKKSSKDEQKVNFDPLEVRSKKREERHKNKELKESDFFDFENDSKNNFNEPDENIFEIKNLATEKQEQKTVPTQIQKPKEILELVAEWGRTLAHFQISKDPRFDEVPIACLLRRHGFEKTRLSLIGQRYEAKTDSFDPAKNLSVSRLMSKPIIFEKLVNLGAQDQTKPTVTRSTAHLKD